MGDSQCKIFITPTHGPNFIGQLSTSLLDIDSNGKLHIPKFELDEVLEVSFRNRQVFRYS